MKSKSTLLCICLLQFFFTYSQNQKYIDSLKTELKKESTNDSIKVVLLTMLHEKLMFSKPEIAKKYADQEIDIYKRTGSEFAYGLGNLHIGDYFYNKSMNDTALYHYQLAKTSFKKNNKTRGLIFVDFTLGDIYKSQGDYESALQIFTNSLIEIEQNIKDEPYKSQFLASSHLSIGSCYFEKGDLNLALKESIIAVGYFEKINDELRTADTYKQLGDIETKLNHHSFAIDYYSKARELYKKNNDNIYEANTIISIGAVYLLQGNLTKAENFYLAGIDLSRKFNLKGSLSSALIDYGEILTNKGDLNEAENALSEANSIAAKEQLTIQSIQSLEGLSKLDLRRNKFQSALRHINEAIEIGTRSGAVITLEGLYEVKSKILEKTGDHKNAISFLRESFAIQDSISSVEKIRQVEELKTIYETEKKEAAIALQEEEIKTLNEKAKVDKLTKGLYAGGMASALALFGLSVFGYRQRIKKNRIAREKQEEIYKQEIAHKKKELASQTLHLVQKNTFLEELKENLENLKSSPDKFKMEFRRIVMLLKKEKASDKDWETFKTYFSEVHNDFDQKLKTLYADISEKEIRLAAFLRMNLTTKEIATTMNVLPDSILKSKYRLKKKLGLNKETDLTEFLNTL
ncbi:tetratricopeptide repeat protein [Flagellimonas lutaonensis]|uniref:Uncharacterized protein n=1 Tax=Flagellimonas lutaonensis TaxID=516051 RepID=A0A0D5YWZ2_9FLAO|nr:tetratricopeptide repeat protein [Allomuricauda lutaonensis]AKA36409.1 hypothetical protein VC82_2863 [Allomuricauda lutaonensis]